MPCILFQPFACILKVRHVDDVVPLENGPRAVAADLRGHAVLDAGALHVAHGRSPQVMEEQPGHSGPLAGFRPAVSGDCPPEDHVPRETPTGSQPDRSRVGARASAAYPRKSATCADAWPSSGPLKAELARPRNPPAPIGCGTTRSCAPRCGSRKRTAPSGWMGVLPAFQQPLAAIGAANDQVA